MSTGPSLSSRACAEYEAQLEDYLSGELDNAAAERAAAHWKSCTGCREALERATTASRWLRVGAALPDAPPAFARTVMARIQMAEDDRAARTGFWQPFVSLGWRFAATATLALGILLAYTARFGGGPQPNVAAVRPTEARDIFSPEPARAPSSGDEVLMMVAESNHGNQ
jgi:anti-sigma factor RsiW